MEIILLMIGMAFSKDACLSGSSECRDNAMHICDINGSWVSVDCPDNTTCRIKNGTVSCLPDLKAKKGADRTDKPDSDDEDDEDNKSAPSSDKKPKHTKEDSSADDNNLDSGSSPDETNGSGGRERPRHKQRGKKEPRDGEKNGSEDDEDKSGDPISRHPEETKCADDKDKPRHKPQDRKEHKGRDAGRDPREDDGEKNDGRSKHLDTEPYMGDLDDDSDKKRDPKPKKGADLDKEEKGNRPKRASSRKTFKSARDKKKGSRKGKGDSAGKKKGRGSVKTITVTRMMKDQNRSTMVNVEHLTLPKNVAGSVPKSSIAGDPSNPANSAERPGVGQPFGGGESEALWSPYEGGPPDMRPTNSFQQPSDTSSQYGDPQSSSQSGGQPGAQQGSGTGPKNMSSGGQAGPDAKQGGGAKPKSNPAGQGSGTPSPQQGKGGAKPDKGSPSPSPSPGAPKDRPASGGDSKGGSSAPKKPDEGQNGKKSGGGGGSGGGAITKSELEKAITDAGFTPQTQYIDAVLAKTNENFPDKAEAAMFIAQLIHESGGLNHIEELACKSGCAGQYGSDKGESGKSYHGRGFIQLTWPDNYKAASQALGKGDTLFKTPEIVAQDPEIAMDVSIWYWQSKVATAPGVKEMKFGATTKAINGAIECSGSGNATPKKRFEIYKKVAQAFGVSNLASEDGCS